MSGPASSDDGSTILPPAVPQPTVPPSPPAGMPAGQPTDIGGMGPMGVAPPAFGEQKAPSGSRRWKPVLAVVVALAVLVGGFVLIRLLAGDDQNAGEALIVVPESVDELWSASVDGEAGAAAVDGDGVFVTSNVSESDLVLVNFDRATGDEVWTAEFDGGGTFGSLAGFVDGVVVVSACDDSCTVYGTSVDDGEVLWSEGVGLGSATVVDGRILTVDDGTVELLDPRTGDSIERVRGDDVQTGSQFVVVTDGDEVQVFDLDLNPLVEPVTVTDADAVDFDGSRVVLAEGNDLRFVDPDGSTASTSSVDVGVIDDIRSIQDGVVILGSDEGIIAVDPRGRVADELWSTQGDIGAVRDVDTGVVVEVERGESYEVVDALSGELVVDGDLDRDTGGFTAFGQNALVVYEFDDVSGPTDLRAVEWETGDELWSETFDGFPYVRDGLVIDLRADGEVVAFG